MHDLKQFLLFAPKIFNDIKYIDQRNPLAFIKVFLSSPSNVFKRKHITFIHMYCIRKKITFQIIHIFM